jgi:VanZ family protein
LSGIGVLLLIGGCLFAGYYPFNWQIWSDPQYDNGAVLVDSELRLQTRGIARSEDVPPWVQKVKDGASLRVSLEVNTDSPKQYGPARIFTVSEDIARRNITIAQHGHDLEVRLRHTGSSLNGKPSRVIPDIFSESQWRQLDVVIEAGELHIGVDGITVDVSALPAGGTSNWSLSYLLAFGNELHGERPWHGRIRKAVVTVDDERIDYLATGALVMPEVVPIADQYRELPRWQLVPFSMKYSTSFISSARDWVVNLLGFIPLGVLLMHFSRAVRPLLVTVCVCALTSVAIEAGQVFLPSRISAIDDIILNSLGGALGAMVYLKLWRRSKVQQ